MQRKKMKTNFKKFLSLTLIFALVAALALSLAGCAKEETKKDDAQTEVVETGTVKVTVEVVDNEENSTEYEISLPKGSTLWDALESKSLAEASDSEYGKFIHTVNGLRADYDLDGAYWALYKDGEYLMTGASDTDIKDGDHFELTYTKG